MMRRMTSVIALAVLAFAASSYAGWQEGSAVGVPIDNGKGPVAVFVTTQSSQTVPPSPIPADQWVRIDLSATGIPEDTRAVFLSGLLIISHPGAGYTCDLWANFRSPGSTLAHNAYQAQTLEATQGAGVRSNAAVWVPVVDQKFEFYWHHTAGCPSAINLSLQAYVR